MGHVGPRGELLRNRPIQLHLHTPASPRRFLERQGSGPISMEDYVRFKVTNMIGDRPAHDAPASADRPAALRTADIASAASRPQSVFVRQNKLVYGDAMKYVKEIEIPRQQLKSRPIVYFRESSSLAPHYFTPFASPRVSLTPRRT